MSIQRCKNVFKDEFKLKMFSLEYDKIEDYTLLLSVFYEINVFYFV